VAPVTECGDITILLRKWSEGDAAASEQLFEVIYPRLRQIAAAILRGERPSAVLQPTSLVNELYLKLLQQRRAQFSDRTHFFSMAARMMRRVLVDHVRYDGRQKRQAGAAVPLHEDLSWVDAGGPDLLDLNSFLDELEQIDPRKCRMVELRFFLGFSAEETAELLDVGKATVDRDLRFVRTWLADRMRPLPE
jgi:RNA polymerase sigma factor (TIGR02999 family)